MDAASGSGYKTQPNADGADEQSANSGKQSDPEDFRADCESVGEGAGMQMMTKRG